MMLVDPLPVWPRRRRVKPKAAVAPVPPAEGPVLVSASFDTDTLLLSLTFDRNVDAGGLSGAAIVVSDPINTGWNYVATGVAGQSGGTLAALSMDSTDTAQPGDAVTLTAAAGNGVVAVDTGATWAGVVGLPLPFEQMTKAKSKRRKRVA